ncbi:hypothetical protein QRD40_23575 [Comamonas sp. Y6]|jgi:hypothetical protein|uniref:Uncharacterized protein n=1 Tax=Comamonas resistens TaxID=3046670 RepID=A0ABY8T0J6_9BURK|nr:hypothetical protein [Comamonas resistens]MDL5039315.1 hypothetical protein [Comamonas resistens]WHS68109.1 hypothetical protein QMY55_24680 [Comamonas resistens]GAD21787.1 hypothetical protein AVS7_01547 [Acidovorax sp. MR-S7]
MSKTKASSLSAGLIAKKGQAVPATASVAPVEDVAAPAPAPAVSVEPAPQSQAQPEAKEAAVIPEAGYYKALTVKLNRARYEKLKTLGMRLDKKSQAIFEAALDDYLAKHADKLG